MASIEVSLVILFIIFVGIEISEMKNEKWDYLKNKWNYLEDSAYIVQSKFSILYLNNFKFFRFKKSFFSFVFVSKSLFLFIVRNFL